MNLPIKIPKQTAKEYLQEHRKFFCDLWAQGYTYKKLAEVIQTHIGLKVTRQGVCEALLPFVTMDHRIQRSIADTKKLKSYQLQNQ